ncbi:hypothetical protein J4443_00620 [Candidatus Woesearchaeota archaeon]|nr:hypothetical protein [Candidatus Woesearchaeota archaeon]
MQKGKLLHAQIKNPILVRKTLLESAISTAEALKSMHEFKKLKSLEGRKKAELRRLFEEVKILRTKLEEEELPRLTEIKHEKIKEDVSKKVLIKEEIKKQRKQETILGKETEKSGLDLEIDRLREKIRNL